MRVSKNAFIENVEAIILSSGGKGQKRFLGCALHALAFSGEHKFLWVGFLQKNICESGYRVEALTKCGFTTPTSVMAWEGVEG